MHTDAERKYAA